MIAALTTPFISTFWVTVHIKRQEKILYEIELQRKVTGTDISLEEIFRNNDLFNLYMQHLIKEFSMECLLSLVEFTQYKQHAIQIFMIDDNEFQQDISFDFPADVPLSDIVYGDISGVKSEAMLRIESNSTGNASVSAPLEVNNMEIFKNKAHELYLKYVAMGSEFEINVSYRTRLGMDKIFGNYDKLMVLEMSEMEMVKVFDKCIEEMTKLLISSRHRFNHEQ